MYSAEIRNGDFVVNLFGEIYGDFFYGYGKHSYNNSILGTSFVTDGVEQSFGSQAFVGSSLLGVEMRFNNISGTFETNLNDPVQRFFLTYYINPEESHFLVIGRDSTLAYYSFGQVSNDLGALNNYGSLIDNYRLQVRYGFKGFELAVIIPSTGGGWNSENIDDAGYRAFSDDINIVNSVTPFMVLPRLEMAYNYINDFLELKLFGSYGAYLYQNTTNKNQLTAHSFSAGVGGQFSFGSSFLQFTGWYGMNLALSDTITNYANIITIDSNTNKMSMNEVFSAGFAVGMGHTFNDRYTPQIGVGYTANFGPGYLSADDSLGAYLNCIIQINDWFSVTPEVAYLDNLNNGQGVQEDYAILAGVLASLSF